MYSIPAIINLFYLCEAYLIFLRTAINHLFSEDPMAFQAAVNKVNASESLEQVVDFVKETYPQWNLESDLVYRFMMAVRRKIR